MNWNPLEQPKIEPPQGRVFIDGKPATKKDKAAILAAYVKRQELKLEKLQRERAIGRAREALNRARAAEKKARTRVEEAKANLEFIKSAYPRP